MEENQKEIQRQFRQQQEKYVYYVLALTVSAIGFGIYKTSGLPLKWSQIPLGLSVICWGISIFCGLMFIKYVISNLYANNVYFDILAGRHPDLGNTPWKKEVGVEGVKRAMESNGKTAEKYFNWQGRLFYAGIVLFILWHILEMYLLSKTFCQ